MIHSMTGHYLILDSFFEKEHALIKSFDLECEQVLHLVSLVVDPFQLQMRNFQALSLEKRGIEEIVDLLLVNL